MEHTLVSPTSGNEYVGHVPVGQLTGTGTFRCAKNGAVYTGEYEGSRFHGIGELTFASGDVYRGQYKGDVSEGEAVYTFADGRRTFGPYKGGEEVSSVPFDAANPAHAAVLRAANAAEARRVGALHRRRA